jgi:hypothetical protein
MYDYSKILLYVLPFTVQKVSAASVVFYSFMRIQKYHKHGLYVRMVQKAYTDFFPRRTITDKGILVSLNMVMIGSVSRERSG